MDDDSTLVDGAAASSADAIEAPNYGNEAIVNEQATGSVEVAISTQSGIQADLFNAEAWNDISGVIRELEDDPTQKELRAQYELKSRDVAQVKVTQKLVVSAKKDALLNVYSRNPRLLKQREVNV